MIKDKEYLVKIEEVGEIILSKLNDLIQSTQKSNHSKILKLNNLVKGILAPCQSMKKYSIPMIQRDILKSLLRANESLRDFSNQNHYPELSIDIDNLNKIIMEWSKKYFNEKEINYFSHDKSTGTSWLRLSITGYPRVFLSSFIDTFLKDNPELFTGFDFYKEMHVPRPNITAEVTTQIIETDQSRCGISFLSSLNSSSFQDIESLILKFKEKIKILITYLKTNQRIDSIVHLVEELLSICEEDEKEEISEKLSAIYYRIYLSEMCALIDKQKCLNLSDEITEKIKKIKNAFNKLAEARNSRYQIYSGVMAGIVIFDKREKVSFHSVRNLIAEYRVHSRYLDQLTLIGVLNQASVISTEEGSNLAKEFEVSYVEINKNDTNRFNQIIREKASRFEKTINFNLRAPTKKPIHWHSPARDKLKERSKECLRNIEDKIDNFLTVFENDFKCPNYSPLYVLGKQIKVYSSSLLEKYTIARTSISPLMHDMIERMLKIAKFEPLSDEITSKIEIIKNDIKELLIRIETEFRPTEEWTKAFYEKREKEHKHYDKMIEKARNEGWR